MSKMGRLSICLCSDDFLPAVTGVGTHVQRLTEELIRQGHRVSVITTRRSDQPVLDSWRGATVYRVFSVNIRGYYQGLAAMSTITRILVENSVEILHVHYLGVLMIQALRAAERHDLPRIYTYHMPVDVLVQHWPMRMFGPLFSRMVVRYCNRFDLIISPSRNLAEKIRQEGVQSPIKPITNPVGFDEAGSAAPVVRPAPFVMLFAGRLEPEKNIPFLLKSFRLMLDTGLEAGLWIAGTGSEQTHLESICRSQGIREQVHFLGQVDHSQLASYYASCDVFVLPSLVETQGLVVMEAMHFARPVIVTRAIIAAKELVDEGRNGYIVDPDNAAELADRLLRMAADPELRERLGRVGREMSLDFAPGAVTQATENAYRAVLRRSPAEHIRPQAQV